MVENCVQHLCSSQTSGTVCNNYYLSSREPFLEAYADINVVYNREAKSHSAKK